MTPFSGRSRVGPPQFENGVEFFLTRWLKIPNFAVAYQKEIASSENIFVLLHHTIRGFSGSDGHIQGASLTDSNGTLHFVESDQTILAAGTIEISRLLLQSAASSDWDCPWKNNRNPGTFFQDHLGGRVASVHPIDRTKFFNTFSTIVRSNHKFQPKLRLTNTTIAENPVLNIQGMFSFESSVSENLVFLKQFLKAAVFSRKIEGISGLFSNLIACGRHLFPLMWKYVIQNRIFVPGTSKISFTIQSEQTPVAESRITLAHGTTDSNGLPKLLLDWRIGTAELTSIRNFTERCQLALREAGLAELEIIEELDSLKPAFLDTLTDNYHLVGGARMGHSAEDGVVDRNLRVFGTNNLYVAGAATFCTTSNANTTFVALAFVTRLVEQLTSPAAPPGERPFTA
jgi:choline dehydrogenase-like flavoprotein